jgi:TPR repeat protein
MARVELDDLKRFELDAEKGTSGALYNLGLIFSVGKGVEPDLITAHKWFNLAALRGSEEAKAQRKELAGLMSAAEVAEAQRLAREWMATHA